VDEFHRWIRGGAREARPVGRRRAVAPPRRGRRTTRRTCTSGRPGGPCSRTDSWSRSRGSSASSRPRWRTRSGSTRSDPSRESKLEGPRRCPCRGPSKCREERRPLASTGRLRGARGTRGRSPPTAPRARRRSRSVQPLMVSSSAARRWWSGTPSTTRGSDMTAHESERGARSCAWTSSASAPGGCRPASSSRRRYLAPTTADVTAAARAIRSAVARGGEPRTESQAP
jgi:hypothetical protein